MLCEICPSAPLTNRSKLDDERSHSESPEKALILLYNPKFPPYNGALRFLFP